MKHTLIRYTAVLLLAAIILIGAVVYVPRLASRLNGSDKSAAHNKDKASLRPTHQHSTKAPPPKLSTTLPVDIIAGRLLCVGTNSTAVAVSLAKNNHVNCFLLRPGGDILSKTASDTIQSASDIKPIFAVDEEGGLVARVEPSRYKRFSAQKIGTLNTSTVQLLGRQMGQSIRSVGANLDFGPVLDIDDPGNAAIGSLGRSFSSEPSVVVQKAESFSRGLHSAGVIPTYKHFPGLGRATGITNGNTDTGPAQSPALSSLKSQDLVPYLTLLPTQRPTAVMVGNQIVPGLTKGQPASLSKNTYTLLRSDYKFHGIVFTDELSDAKAISTDTSSAVIRALQSGADMPLINTNTIADVVTVLDAVKNSIRCSDGAASNSPISCNNLNDSLRRRAALTDYLQ